MAEKVEAAAPCGGELALVSSQRRPSGYLELPYEIRLQIHRLCLPQGRLFDVSRLFDPYNRFVKGGLDDSENENSNLRIEDDQPELVSEPAYDLPKPDSECWDLGDKNQFQESDENQFQGSDEDQFDPLECWDLGDENQPHESDEDQLDHSERLDDHLNYFTSRRPRILPSLLVVSRQISDEALDVLYGENTFMVCLNREGEDHLKEKISEANRPKMRHFMLVVRPVGALHPLTLRMDTAMWDNVLPHVRTLWMYTNEHWYIVDPQYSGRTYAEKMQQWVDYLTQLLEYLAKRLSTEAKVLVEVDEGDETDEVIQKYLPHGYRPMMKMDRRWGCVRGEWWVKWGNWAWDWDHDMNDYSGCKDPCDYELDAIRTWCD